MSILLYHDNVQTLPSLPLVSLTWASQIFLMLLSLSREKFIKVLLIKGGMQGEGI